MDNLLETNLTETNEEPNITDSLLEDLNLGDDFKIPSAEEIEIPLSPLITERETLDLQLSLEDFSDMIKYIRGIGPKPSYLDKMTSDAENRLKDIVYIINFSQLSNLPSLIALQGQIRERLFAPENLYSMDSKELTAASANVSKEIQSTLDSAIKMLQTTSQLGSLNNEYRNLIDMILNMPEDKLNRIKEIVYRQD